VADAVGIDLGTSFSTLAVAAGDTVQPVPDAHGRTQHPSLVFYGGAGTRGPLVGWDARKLQAQHPERTVAGIKRLLGQRYSAPDISAYLQQLPFPCTAGDDDGISLLFDAAPIPAAEVSATVLRHLRQLAETQLGKQIGRAVLAHPAGFDERRQASLLQAAQLAGIEPMQLIPEALAAGLAFGHGNSGNEVVGVYDLGTTFEFSVLELSATHFRVLGSAGDPWLGGDAIDQSMAKAVANTFWRRTAIELHAIGPDWQRLMLTCERAKRRLSTDEVTLIDVPQMAESTDLSQQVDRGAMGRICGPVLDRSLQLCRGVLEGAGLGVGDLDGLVLAGGITRLPHVRQRVEAFFEREGSQAEVHPEDAVALGSALFAARLAGHPARVARSIDV
jgi:molecular chaperone DnaK